MSGRQINRTSRTERKKEQKRPPPTALHSNGTVFMFCLTFFLALGSASASNSFLFFRSGFSSSLGRDWPSPWERLLRRGSSPALGRADEDVVVDTSSLSSAAAAAALRLSREGTVGEPVSVVKVGLGLGGSSLGSRRG